MTKSYILMAAANGNLHYFDNILGDLTKTRCSCSEYIIKLLQKNREKTDKIRLIRNFKRVITSNIQEKMVAWAALNTQMFPHQEYLALNFNFL